MSATITMQSTNITPTANLIIKLHMEQHSKKKRQAKYRVVQRDDGIVVEFPRYHPAHAPPKQEFKFEQKLFNLPPPPPRPSPKARKLSVPRSTDDTLAGIGACMARLPQESQDSPVPCGRGGYNDSFHATRDIRAQISGNPGYGLDRQRDLTPMERFMVESGPWSSFSCQER